MPEMQIPGLVVNNVSMIKPNEDMILKSHSSSTVVFYNYY